MNFSSLKIGYKILFFNEIENVKNHSETCLKAVIWFSQSTGKFIKKSKDDLHSIMSKLSARLTLWMNKPRPWLMPLCMALMAVGYWAQLHGYGMPITVDQWSRK